MLVNIIVLLILVFGLLKGWRRGFILQAVRIVGFILAIVVARFFYRDFAPALEDIIPYPEGGSEILEVLPLESTYYHIIAFILLMFISRIAIQILARALNVVAHLPVIHTLNRFLGAVLGLVERFVIVFVVLLILALIPATATYVFESSVAMTILRNTPFVGEFITTLGLITP